MTSKIAKSTQMRDKIKKESLLEFQYTIKHV